MSIAPGLSGDRRLPLITLLIVVILAGVSPLAAVAEPTEKAQHHFQAGLQHKKDGDMTEALQELNSAINESSDYADAYWVRGWVQAGLNDNDGSCLSFNMFLGLVPDDQRSEQAKAAIERLGGTVTPQQPGEATAGAAASTDDQEFTEQPAVTPEEASALVDEAAQALVDGQFETAIGKCLLAEPVLADDAGLHRLLSLSYGAVGEWAKAFKHVETALQSDPSESLRLYQILAALAQEDNRVPAGYNGALQMDSRLLSTEHYTQESLAKWHEWNQSLLIAEDGTKAAPQLIGRAISRFRMYYDNPEDYPVMMQLAHNDLRTALRAPCPDHLLPENNEWTSKLVGIDFLRAQAETERTGYEQGLAWALDVRIGRTDEQEIGGLRESALAEYSSQPAANVEYQTGLALAEHDEIWEYRIPANPIEQLTTIPWNSVDELRHHIQPLVGSRDMSDRVGRLADFVDMTEDTMGPVEVACQALLDRIREEAMAAAAEAARAAEARQEQASARAAAQTTITSPQKRAFYIRIAEEVVRPQLKAPRTAEFSGGEMRQPEVWATGDGLVHVWGNVDAQNSYGAMIRGNYIVTMKADGSVVSSYVFGSG